MTQISQSLSPTVTTPVTVHRIEVRPRPGMPDARGDAARRQAEAAGVSPAPTRVEAASVYLIEGPLDDAMCRTLAEELLADAVTEDAVIGATAPTGDTLVEVHNLPGVMDPDAESIELAIRTTHGLDVRVMTGRRYDIHGLDARTTTVMARRCLANTVVHAIHDSPYQPDEFPHGHDRDMSVPEIPLRDLDDVALERLSRDAHLFLSLEEMRTIRDAYRSLGREPREIELETLAQTWSEHCVHKTLKATIRYRETPGEGSPALDPTGRPGHVLNEDGSITIDNLLRSTIAAATHELMNDGIDWCLSVFVDNAGIIAFDDEHAVCFKCETHNHPSAIEPYGGAATGIGGCIRDIIGTGLAARPIAATDIFCVAHPDRWAGPGEPASETLRALPAGCLHPRRTLTQIVSGVRDYGNRMGIPTLNGAVWFHDDYVGNPLVYCGCVGVMPRDLVHGDPQAGDRIIALGGRTGRDGIHGATFSSAELTDTHADEFSHAVQIGNPVTEKKVLDAILAARDHTDGCLFSAITDCGAGGFSSAVGEMGEQLGASVNLDAAPLKYTGLTPTEIWISEAQERMVLAVPHERLDALRAICDLHDVELCDLGEFGTPERDLILHYHGDEVGRLPMEFLHDGVPMPTREAAWSPSPPPLPTGPIGDATPAIEACLCKLLAHPNIASKHWIVRQYDHEVQGRSVVRPLVGPGSNGPSDAAVVMPVADSNRALGIGNGLATGLARDPYVMTLAAIDECIRNLVCVGTDPEHIAILDNFCWPGCNDERSLGDLVRAAEACYDGAMAYRTPFISGKDSLNNQFTTEDGETIRIPATLLISGFGIVPNVQRCVTMDAKTAGNVLIIVGETGSALGGSHLLDVIGDPGATRDASLPIVDLDSAPRTARAVHRAIRHGFVRSAHDCSDGGLLVAAAEMAMAGGLGLELDLVMLPFAEDARREDLVAACFAETPGRYLLEVSRDAVDAISATLDGLPFAVIGEFNETGHVSLAEADLNIANDVLFEHWHGTLDW